MGSTRKLAGTLLAIFLFVFAASSCIFDGGGSESETATVAAMEKTYLSTLSMGDIVAVTEIPLVQIMPSTWTPEPTITQAPTNVSTSTNTITPTIRITIKLITPIKYPTATPRVIQPPNNPPSCPSAYDKANHEYYLQSLHDIYQNDVNYYNYLKQKAVADQDAFSLLHIQQILDSVTKDYKARVKKENSRYAALCK